MYRYLPRVTAVGRFEALQSANLGENKGIGLVLPRGPFRRKTTSEGEGSENVPRTLSAASNSI